jgi:hypothetical protein
MLVASAFALVAVMLPAPQQAPENGASTTVSSSAAMASAVRTPQTPRIDGRADDAVWRSAPRHSGFRQFEPKVDVDPTHATEFQVAYDDKSFYVFVRMFDAHPDSIMRALSRRDVRGPSDQIKILIDSYDDKRSGYTFAVNPDGVKRDFAMSDDGNEDGSWDGVWDVATQVDSLGWTAEFRIPLSQLRYANADSHTFGFGVWRDIERYAERSSWPLWSPRRTGLSSQLGRLSGFTGLTTARRIEGVPYVVTKDVQRPLTNGGFRRDQELTVGGDLKAGITPNVTLSATVNPDFGQVEADPAVVNLTAFETFFSERRPFFVEGTGLYRFSLNCYIVVDCSTNEGLFYSRRIGRSPALRDRYGDAGTPYATPIAAATKLTGRTGSGLAFGLLDAVTPRVPGRDDKTVEPATNFAVFRAQQDLRGGNAGVSVIATAVNRSLDSLSRPYLHRSAYVAGASVRNRFGNQNYELNGQFTASRVSGTPAVIARTQTNPVHYFQQPGDEHGVDTTRTSLSGHAAQIKFGKYGGGITRFESSVVRQSAGFDVNDLGFLRRADFTDWSTWAALSWREEKWIYRWAQVNANHWIRWNTSGTRLDHSTNFNGHMGFRNNWNAHLGATVANVSTTMCDRCTRGGPVLRQSRGFYPWGGVNTDSRKDVSGGMWVNYGRGDEGRSRSISYSPYMTFRFSTRLGANVGLAWSKNTADAQWLGNFTDSAGLTHFAFAHLEQRTASTNARVNYTVTPDLTFEFYGEPFVSKRTYTNPREVSSTPGAPRREDRFTPYALPPGEKTVFRSAQLRTNAVVRWEYRPGSTLFVVWQHGRQQQSNEIPEQSVIDDYRNLLSLHPDNTILVKLAYWLSR